MEKTPNVYIKFSISPFCFIFASIFTCIICAGVTFAATQYDIYLECTATQLVRPGAQPIGQSHIVWGLSLSRRVASMDLKEELPLVIEEGLFKIGGWGSNALAQRANRVQAIINRYTGEYSLFYYFGENSELSQYNSLFEGNCSKASSQNYQKKF